MYRKANNKLSFILIMGLVSLLAAFAQTLWLRNTLDDLGKRIFKKINNN
ncbi:hypothetical protein J2W47_006311 [Priestia megaterium]|jgi:hypothetical protein|nr:hypothetical protein [Priestia megaterium]